MKILNAIALGILSGTGVYLLLTSFHALPSSRSMAYGLFVGAAVAFFRSGGDHDAK